MKVQVLTVALVGALFGSACEPSEGSLPDAGAVPRTHAVHISVVLRANTGGVVSFPAQNGTTVPVLASDLVGKTSYWVSTPGGEPPGNAAPIDQLTATIGADLRASFTTPQHYQDGIWEFAGIIAVSGVPPVSAPRPGDLAAFDVSPPLAGEPPQTGQTVRVRVNGETEVELTNESFIRVGGQ